MIRWTWPLQLPFPQPRNTQKTNSGEIQFAIKPMAVFIKSLGVIEQLCGTAC